MTVMNLRGMGRGREGGSGVGWKNDGDVTQTRMGRFMMV